MTPKCPHCKADEELFREMAKTNDFCICYECKTCGHDRFCQSCIEVYKKRYKGDKD